MSAQGNDQVEITLEYKIQNEDGTWPDGYHMTPPIGTIPGGVGFRATLSNLGPDQDQFRVRVECDAFNHDATSSRRVDGYDTETWNMVERGYISEGTPSGTYPVYVTIELPGIADPDPIILGPIVIDSIVLEQISHNGDIPQITDAQITSIYVSGDIMTVNADVTINNTNPFPITSSEPDQARLDFGINQDDWLPNFYRTFSNITYDPGSHVYPVWCDGNISTTGAEEGMQVTVDITLTLFSWPNNPTVTQSFDEYLGTPTGCTEGERRCLANYDLQECQNGEWVTIETDSETCHDEPLVYVCPHCGMEFYSQEALDTHISQEHPDILEPSWFDKYGKYVLVGVPLVGVGTYAIMKRRKK